MNAYFHGWRRKIGVVTLVIALAFMGGWIRSLLVKDRIEFSRFMTVTKQDKHLAGLATDRQSLVILAYKVDEVECRFENGSTVYTKVDPQSADVTKIETVSAVVVGAPALISATFDLQSTGVNLITTVENAPPAMMTDSEDGQSTSSIPANGLTTSNFSPLPASMLANPPMELSIRPNYSTHPLSSVLTAVYEVPVVVIPFWAIVIPLTLISLWLLVMPRTSQLKQINTADTVPT